ncbi:DUF5798 family protein [Natronorubrum sp. DTA28]|uniref:DUF5798 family protein n=1 Tax=Natronorubrum sp. DTA28 TaxID=3447019 RepID=UPI003F843239
MGLGSTAKKIQSLSDRAEAMYKQVQELQQRIIGLEEEVDDTHDTVKSIDHQLTEQRALLLALAEEQGIDGEQILAEAAIDEAEAAGDGDDVEDSTDTGTDGNDDVGDAKAADATAE